MRTPSSFPSPVIPAVMLALLASCSCAVVRAGAANVNRVQCALAPAPKAQRAHLPAGIEAACSAGSLAYIVPVEGGVVLVDTGFDESGAPVKAALHGRRVRAVLLTHAHLDHRAAAAAFRAPVYVGRADVDLLEGKRGSRAVGARFGDLAGVPPRPRTVIAVDDGDALAFGETVFTAVALPGHTPGSTGWLLGTTMFTGDAAQAPRGDAIYPGPAVVTDDMRAAYESLRKLRARRVTTILDGHFGRLDDVARHVNDALARIHDDAALLEQPADRPAGCAEE